MVQEYTDQMYMPCYDRARSLTGTHLEEGLKFAAWKGRLYDAWRGVYVRDVRASEKVLRVGTELRVSAEVHLGQLTPDDVQVELYYGPLGPRGDIASGGEAVPMQLTKPDAVDGSYHFSANVKYSNSGQRGLSVRVLPKHGSLPSPFQLRIVRWAK